MSAIPSRPQPQRSGISPLQNLLDRLDKVRGHNGQYTARCPAHDDRGPSLSITEADDGKVLVHCHAGCTADEVTGAVGLELRDLFPETTLTTTQRHHYKKQQTCDELERALHHELNVLTQVIGGRLSDRELAKDTRFRAQRPDWQPAPEDPWERELLAVSRIKVALGELYA